MSRVPPLRHQLFKYNSFLVDPSPKRPDPPPNPDLGSTSPARETAPADLPLLPQPERGHIVPRRPLPHVPSSYYLQSVEWAQDTIFACADSLDYIASLHEIQTEPPSLAIFERFLLPKYNPRLKKAGTDERAVWVFVHDEFWKGETGREKIKEVISALWEAYTRQIDECADWGEWFFKGVRADLTERNDKFFRETYRPSIASRDSKLMEQVKDYGNAFDAVGAEHRLLSLVEVAVKLQAIQRRYRLVYIQAWKHQNIQKGPVKKIVGSSVLRYEAEQSVAKGARGGEWRVERAVSERTRQRYQI